ncbi:MAG TPA: hypothetical protein DER01_00500 [Phycisphaerales bacterium]|nr:hypothetical protein [Phycisphaerales bacterium]|tara:strand:- start:252 stop:452 length:201 start_codon:yes stop_codon:yes gene_type:complete
MEKMMLEIMNREVDLVVRLTRLSDKMKAANEEAENCDATGMGRGEYLDVLIEVDRIIGFLCGKEAG